MQNYGHVKQQWMYWDTRSIRCGDIDGHKVRKIPDTRAGVRTRKGKRLILLPSFIYSRTTEVDV